MSATVHECDNGSLVRQEGNYHYLESGLPNVYLANIEWYKCQDCGKTEANIPRIGQLHRCLAWRIICKSDLLTGMEIRFLRKMMRAKQSEFAAILSIHQTELSRWESGARPRRTKPADLAIRLFYLAFKDDEYTKEAHRIVTRELRKFELLRKAAPLPDGDTIVIDPSHCGKAQEVSALLEG